LTRGWRYEITPKARRDLRRLDPPVRVRVLQALDRYVQDPEFGDVARLTGTGHLRLRVGDWRVRFARDDDARTIVVLRVLPRGRAYDR
jgi:mRNA interferase RelE/StbE